MTERRAPSTAPLVIAGGACLVLLASCSAPRGDVAVNEAPQGVVSSAADSLQPVARTLKVPCSDAVIELVWIPAAQAWVSRTEITWDQYLPFCGWDAPLPEGVDAESRPSEPLEVEPYDHGFGKGAHPAVGVSWRGAQSYAEWLSAELGEPFGLPTAAEWEGMTAGLWELSELDPYAWHAGNAIDHTEVVGTREASATGLHDLVGNLWEYGAEPFDPADDEVPVLRGGSYRTPPDRLSPSLTRAFDYDWLLKDPTFPPGRWWVPDGDEVGFRLVSRAPGP